MAGRLPITLLSAAVWGALVNAIPADPTITPPAVLPRQANAAFIGWLEYNSTWYSQTCDVGLTWYQDGNYAQCCPDTVASCNAPTACVGGSQIYPLGSTTITTACTGNYNNTAYSICNTAFIFESFGDSNPKTDIVCGDSSVNWSYFRKIPATATEKSSEAPSSSPSPAGSAVTTGPTSSPTQEPEKSSSKAWIAGAVIGPIVGIALIAGIIFFLVRRKHKTPALPQSGTAAMGGPPPGVQPYTDDKPQMSPTPGYAQTSPGFNPNQPYDPQYGQSPTPGYVQPYDAPGSPPPVGAYAPAGDNKGAGYYAAQQGHPEAAELGGSTSPHTAELPAENGPK